MAAIRSVERSHDHLPTVREEGLEFARGVFVGIFVGLGLYAGLLALLWLVTLAS